MQISVGQIWEIKNVGRLVAPRQVTGLVIDESSEWVLLLGLNGTQFIMRPATLIRDYNLTPDLAETVLVPMIKYGKSILYNDIDYHKVTTPGKVRLTLLRGAIQ